MLAPRRHDLYNLNPEDHSGPSAEFSPGAFERTMSSDLDFLPRPPTGRGRAGPGASRGATGMQEAELQRLEERIRAECGKSRAKAKSSEDGAKAKAREELEGYDHHSGLL